MKPLPMHTLDPVAQMPCKAPLFLHSKQPHTAQCTTPNPPPTCRQVMHRKVVGVEHLILFHLQLVAQLQLRRPANLTRESEVR